MPGSGATPPPVSEDVAPSQSVDDAVASSGGVIASGDVELLDMESFDFVTGEKGVQTGGDLYIRTMISATECGDAEVWANFPPQVGGIFLQNNPTEDLAVFGASAQGLQESSFSPLCTGLQEGGIYIYKRHAPPMGYVIFRVNVILEEAIALSYIVFGGDQVTTGIVPTLPAEQTEPASGMIASGDVELADTESYDFVTGDKKFQAGGDLYVRTSSASDCGGAEVWANFPPQGGGLYIFSDMVGELSSLDPASMGLQDSAFSPFCTELLEGGVYIYKRHEKPGDYVVFKVSIITEKIVGLSYIVIEDNQESAQSVAPTVMPEKNSGIVARGDAELFDMGSFDAVTDEKQSLSGGDFYINIPIDGSPPEVCANNSPQIGGMRLFDDKNIDLTDVDLSGLGLKDIDFYPACLELEVDGIYIYKRHEKPGDYVIFRVDKITDTSVVLLYIVRDASEENSSATLAVRSDLQKFEIPPGSGIKTYYQPGKENGGTFQVWIIFTVIEERDGFLHVSWEAGGSTYDTWVKREDVEQYFNFSLLDTDTPLCPGYDSANTPSSTPSTVIRQNVVAPVPSATSVDKRPVCRDGACLENDVVIDYLIITRPLFIESLQPFINWKSDKGYRVGLVTVDWLDQTFEGRHLAERMKTGMHEIRRKVSSATALYVLLVGDTEIERENWHVNTVLASYNLSLPWNVPTGYYRRFETDPPNQVLPSDAYFTEDRNWDPDNTCLNPIPDQAWGQGTFDATLFLGRWSVRQADEIRAIVQKTMEVSPTDKIWFAKSTELYDSEYDKTIPCIWPPPSGHIEGDIKKYCNYNPYAQLFGENSPWLVSEQDYIDTTDATQVTTTLYEKLFNYDGAVYTGFHGDYDCMVMEGSRCVGKETFQFHSTFPLYQPSACSVSEFYSGSEDVLLESFIKSYPGPAIISASGHNEYDFYRLLRTGAPVGEAFWRAGDTYAYFANPILLLGDPSLQILKSP